MKTIIMLLFILAVIEAGCALVSALMILGTDISPMIFIGLICGALFTAAFAHILDSLRIIRDKHLS